MCLKRRDQLEIFTKCYLDFDGFLKAVPSDFSELLGYARDDLINKPLNKVVHSEDQALSSSFLDKLKTGKVVEGECELRLLTKSGEPISVFMRGILMRDNTGTLIPLSAIYKISLRKRRFCKSWKKENNSSNHFLKITLSLSIIPIWRENSRRLMKNL